MEWWDNELIMEFLDLYEAEPAIWNPQHEHHKDRNKVHHAWTRISANISIDCSFKELKRKKERLMSTYRKLAMKVKNSAGSGTTDVFKPEWFAYDRMVSFLHDVYTPRKPKTSKGSKNVLENDEDLLDNEDETNSNTAHLSVASESNSASPDQTQDTASTETTKVNEGGPPAGKKRKPEKTGMVEKRMEEAYLYLKQVSANAEVVKDESSMFCELLACKLRALDEKMCEVAMHEINNLMYHIKKSTKQQPNLPFQQPECFQSYDVNPIQLKISHETNNVHKTFNLQSFEEQDNFSVYIKKECKMDYEDANI